MLTRSIFTILICTIAAVSTIYNSSIAPTPVFADDNVSIPLTRGNTSTEPPNASATLQIDSQADRIELTLNQASPNATYTLMLVSSTESSQLGAFAADQTGHGAMHASLDTGIYSAMFEVLRENLVQFTSATVTFAISATASTTVTSSISNFTSTSASNEAQATTLQTQFLIDPASTTVAAGGYATYSISLQQQTNATVFLAAKGVPPGSVAIFSQDSGQADPEFDSILTIVTSPNTLAATYAIMVVALVNGQEYDQQVTLAVTESATTATQSSNMTASSEASLSLTIGTDEYHYEANATVILQGYVTDSLGNVVPGANVMVQVDGATGIEVASLSDIVTDAVGGFRASFQLPNTAQPGTYTAFASATKQGYESATTRATFVVESPSTPSVVVQSVYTGDSAGNPITVFSPGQTVYVWVVIQNIGSTFQGVIWVQVRDPNGIPIQVLIRMSSIEGGETFRDGYGFTLQGKLVPGLYSIEALISDNLISQGGVFLASSSAQFEVVSS